MAGVRQLLLYFVTVLSLFLPTAIVASTFPTSLPGCPEKCGDVPIPYPFGIVDGCYRDGFYVTCNYSLPQPKPFLGENIDLLEINITSAEAVALNYIGYDCSNQTSQEDWNNPSLGIRDLKAFLFSHKRNKFTVIGCYSMAYIEGKQSTSNASYASGCASFCDSLDATTDNNGSCNGMGCCQTTIPAGLDYYEVKWGFNMSKSNALSFNPCSYAALMQDDWYHFRVDDLVGYKEFRKRNNDNVPIVLDWAIRENGTCLASHVENSTNRACKSRNSKCDNTTNGDGYICKCLDGYEGNPYFLNGCIDIDECSFLEKYPCMGTCNNRDGSYECFCPKGTHGDGKARNCTKIPEKFPYPARVAIASIGSIAVLVALCFLVAVHQQHKKHTKEKQAYQRYYEMMNNHLRVFNKKQIEVSTNNFSETNIIGMGGQGHVYKGLLDNDQVVAIKKAKKVEETQRGEFVNEIILLSQLNHKNIVRLLGCCLEVKIPMLVYEFVPNGTLFDLLHSKRGYKPISLGIRLKIAMESAIALDHLHSTIACSIIHGDVKSANILLDADYTAKVSDFGASSVVPVNEIVELVHYSHGYLDPECLYTQLITKNSDIYSFGVVLLELVTRKEAIFIDDGREKKSLATCFLSKARKNEHLEMLDADIVTNDKNVMEVLEEICEIAMQCLSTKGEDRPTMMHVAEELQKLVRFHNRSLSRQIDEEEMESLLGERISSMSEASGFHSTQYSAMLEFTSGAPR